MVHESTAAAQYMDTVSGDQRDGLDDFLHNIETNTRQYIKLFAEAADIAMPAPNRNDIPNDVFDVLLEQVAQTPTLASREPHARAPYLQWQSCNQIFPSVYESNNAQRKKGVELQQEALTEAGIPVMLLLRYVAA